ncbi:MAG: B12-binding domain-containing radical SAM protein, partial [Candidatus Hodarchaeota archaeon]
ETKYINGVCIGEGELPLLKLIDCLENQRAYENTQSFWFSIGDQIIKNEVHPLVENLDELPFPDRSIFNYKDIFDYPGFIFARGCPYNCTYCINHKLQKIYQNKGKFIRFRSVEKAIKEIEMTIADFKIRKLYIDNDTFNMNYEWLKNFCEAYESIRLPFICNLRAEGVTEEITQMLKRAGCEQVNIGLETGDFSLRKSILNRKMSNKQIISAFKMAKKAGLKTFSFNMVGFPEETPTRFQKTILLNSIIKPENMQISIFYPYLGTVLGDYCKEKNYIKKEFQPNIFTNSILNLPNFSAKEIKRAQKWFNFNVFKTYSRKKALFSLLQFISAFNQLNYNNQSLIRRLLQYLKNLFHKKLIYN